MYRFVFSATLIFCLAVFVLCPAGGWAALPREYIQQIQSGQFSVLEENLTRLENARDKDSDGMFVFHRTMSRMSADLAKDPEASLELLNKWCNERNSYLSFLLRGLFYADFAWADRGSKFSDDVLPEAWQAFKDRLVFSQKDLEQAALLNTASAEPWVALMLVFRGLSLPEKIDEAFEKAVSIDKNHFHAYHMMMIARMEKWFGSNEAMFEFARTTYEQHKDDPVFAFLLIQANDELAQRMALQTGGKRSDYHKVPVNYNKIRSLLDEIFRVYPQSLKAMSWSATIEYFNGNYPAVLKQMEQMGNEVDEDIWGNKESYLQTKAWLEKRRAKGIL